MRSEEERYEAIQLILKQRADGKSWGDVIFDMVTADCEGTGNWEDEGEGSEPDVPCTCSLTEMSWTGGTSAQCYRWLYPDWDDDFLAGEDDEDDAPGVGC